MPVVTCVPDVQSVEKVCDSEDYFPLSVVDAVDGLDQAGRSRNHACFEH